MENDDIAQMLNGLVKKTEEAIEITTTSNDASLNQARRLLNNWANHTETFQPNSKKKNEAASLKKKSQKTVRYRKLDAPMMVAKKEASIRPSVDPTLIMEARLAHVKELKAKRLERIANKSSTKSSTNNSCDVSSICSVDIPDIDSEIESYKLKIAERMKEKEKELAERERRSEKNKVIDENVAQVIAQENEQRKKAEKEDAKIDESLLFCMQLLTKAQASRCIKKFFSKWASDCQFHSLAFEKAEALNNTRHKSAAFSVWINKLRKRQNEREVTILERQLRKNKHLESLAETTYQFKSLRKALSQWRIKFKASSEYRIIEEQHKKRRDLIVNKIPEPVLIEGGSDENQKEGRVLKIKKIKIKEIKPNSRMEAMAKRMEEQRVKKLEKAQKECQINAEKEEEQIKIQLDIQRKKKQEHREFLEKEKIKREEMKKRLLTFENEARRRKYCEKVSQSFRLKRLVLNQFIQWKRILLIREKLEELSQEFFENHTKRNVIQKLSIYAKSQRDNRNQDSEAKYYQFLLYISFQRWGKSYKYYQSIENRVSSVSNRWRVKRTLKILFNEKKKRRKAKYSVAAQFAQKMLLKRFFIAWPLGCSLAQEEQEHENNRQDLMSKALRYLEELDLNEI